MTPIPCIRYRPLAFAFVVVLLLADVLHGRIVPARDPRDGVLDASLVVIVRQERKGLFRIEEVLLGEKTVGDTIKLPDFRLYTVQMHGAEKVEPITEAARVLLFLKSKDNDPEAFEATQYGYCFLWVQDPAKVGELRGIAKKAVNLRRSWEKARGIVDETKRVKALWPYLWDHGGSFFRHTRKELQKTGTVAGEQIAERFPGMGHGHRMALLPELGACGGDRLHAVLIGHLKQQQKAYDAFLARHGPGAKGIIEDWSHAPNEITDIWGELYYGLTGLAGFRDKTDLPFVRELALWAVDRRFKQTCDAALGAFGDMPERANLPVIEAIWKEFSARPYEGNPLSPFAVTRALRTHRFPETVPILAQLLGNEDAGGEARRFLAEIVGEDLGEDPTAWLDWHESHKKGAGASH